MSIRYTIFLKPRGSSVWSDPQGFDHKKPAYARYNELVVEGKHEYVELMKSYTVASYSCYGKPHGA